jgi:acylphosphatase
MVTAFERHDNPQRHLCTPRRLAGSGSERICNDGTMTDQRAISATVTGRVQGVGYRYAVIHMANELGLVGWVQNTPNGSVKTWAQGDELVLEQFVEYLQEGPRSAQVRSVDVFPVEPDESLQGFVVRP